MKLKSLVVFVAALFLSACAQEMVKHKYNATAAITKPQYTENSNTMGTVLLAVNWNRYWGCGGYENAELRSIGFDHMPNKHTTNEQAPDFILNGSAGGPDFIVYSSMLEPGSYAISRIKIKVAQSMSDVGYLTLERSSLFNSDTPLGGEFNISAGEVVYIGHFGLDCATKPMLWRYHKEDKKAFNEFVEKTKIYIPYLNLSNVQFRLFQTNEFGHDFSL